MKRFLSLCFLLAITISLSGCAEEVQTPNYKADSIDFFSVVEDVSATRYAEITTPFDEGIFTEYLVNDTDSVDLLTDEETQLLFNYTTAHLPETISVEDALYDVDLLFRMLHSAYGAYYYFGTEKFTTAEENIVLWIKENCEIDCSASALNSEIIKELSFVEDAHFMLYDDWHNENFDDSAIRHEYFYCPNIEFSLDEQGYFQEDDSGKWYVSSFSDGRVSIERTLTKDGRIVFSPVLFCTRSTVEDTVLTLVNSDGESKEVLIKWIETEHGKLGDRFRYIESDDLSYVAMQGYEPGVDDALLPQIEQAALQTQNSKIVIYDLRSHPGGGIKAIEQWMQSYCQIPLSELKNKSLFGIRDSKLFRLVYPWVADELGGYHYDNIEGIWHENDALSIVLVDDRCGSGGEDAINYLKTMDNTIVIGSNSAGYQLCGNTSCFRLPHTGLYAQFGCSLIFCDKLESVEFRGYMPDIWCNPADAMEAVTNLLINHGVSEDTLTNVVDELGSYVSLTLWFVNQEIPPEVGFGAVAASVQVLADGEPVSGYTVENENDEVCTVEIAKDGTMQITSVGLGDSWLTIQYEKSSARFKWHSNGF